MVSVCVEKGLSKESSNVERLRKRVSILGVTSYGQPTALIPPEASPHKRRPKCDTNISPRRLLTHLLHQMVHHRTNLRGGGHSIQTIIRSKKATVIHQSTIHMGSSSGSEYRVSESIPNRANTTGRVGCRMEPLLNVLGNKVWIFLCKIKQGVSTNVLSKSNRTHGVV